MIEYIQHLSRTNPLEFYTAGVATLGVVFWVLDRRSMKAALKATKDSDFNTLRLQRQKIEASVEQSFVALKIKCQVTRNAWMEHERRNGPMLRSPLHVSEEEKEIKRIELAAQTHLKNSEYQRQHSKAQKLMI